MFAISYDPVETLRRFAGVHGVTYPLLSDDGSTVIRRLGLLNTTIEEERAAYGRPMEDRHRGLPYPGSFFLDEDGLVFDKRFEQSHRIRPTGATLLTRLVGEDRQPAVAAEASSPGVRAAAWLDTDVVYANQLQEVHLRIETAPGVHLYVDPVPDGFSPLTVGLSGDERLRSRPVEIGPGEPFSVDGLDEEFAVLHGRIDLVAPFILLSNRDTAGDEARSVDLAVEVGFQACTAEVCHVPESVVLSLTLEERPNPGYETTDRAAISPLVLRRLIERPRPAGELLASVNAALEGATVSGSELDGLLRDLAAAGLVEQDDSGCWLAVG